MNVTFEHNDPISSSINNTKQPYSLEIQQHKHTLEAELIDSSFYNGVANSGFRSACFIPWKGVILEPSYNQIRKFGGNLDLIRDFVGSRPPTEKERNYKQIRIFFANHLLTPTPRELLEVKGDLHLLIKTFPHRASFQPQSSRQGSRWAQNLHF